jgi:hypothetical protein
MRLLNPKLYDWLDSKMITNPIALKAIEHRKPRALLVEAARACVGIREVGGNNQGPMVELLQDTIGRPEREAWCMSFDQSLIAYVEARLGIRSEIFSSEHCMTVYNSSPKSLRVKSIPLPGALCIWRKGTTASGHTGILLEYGPKVMTLVEGNTEAGFIGGKVERDGGGVYLTERSIKGTGSLKVVGFLKPF